MTEKERRKELVEKLIDQAARWGWQQAKLKDALRNREAYEPPRIVWSEAGDPVITNWMGSTQ